MIMEDLDWNKLWMEAIENGSLRKRRGDRIEFWNKIAERYNESVKHNDRSMEMISKLDIDPACTVLDIGAGPGTLTIPLAKIALHVTAVEPSSGMLSYLNENARSEGFKNITCINKRWEDIIPGVDIDAHDVVIASYSLMMLDMKRTLSKMDEVARRSVYLFDFAGGLMRGYSELWPKLYSEEFRTRPDYIYLYNILYGMGIYANVEISETEHKERFSSTNEAVEQWMLKLDTSEAEEVIRSYLSANLVEEDGAFYLKNEMKSVMIWWKKEGA